MPLRVYTVDAFTDRPFAGNPAAVCLLDGPAPEPWMQALAAEHNLSETAFVHPVDGGWSLRWFTPSVEVDLCGHATLATAHVLTVEEGVTAGELRFTTRSGWLTARRAGDGAIELDFPADPAEPVTAPPGLLDALLGDTAGDAEAVLRGRFDYVVVLPSPAAVRACRPHFGRLATYEVRGVAVTAAVGPGGDPAGPDVDIVSRFFGPGSGIDEDPVTARPTACSAPTGRSAWRATRWLPIRRRPGAAPWPSRCAATGWRCGAPPSPCRATGWRRPPGPPDATS